MKRTGTMILIGIVIIALAGCAKASEAKQPTSSKILEEPGGYYDNITMDSEASATAERPAAGGAPAMALDIHSGVTFSEGVPLQYSEDWQWVAVFAWVSDPDVAPMYTFEQVIIVWEDVEYRPEIPISGTLEEGLIYREGFLFAMPPAFNAAESDYVPSAKPVRRQQ